MGRLTRYGCDHRGRKQVPIVVRRPHKAKEIFATDAKTAASARRAIPLPGGCEGREAEVSSGAVAKECSVPANSCQTRATTKPAKIDLRGVPSSMEQMAAQWRGNR